MKKTLVICIIAFFIFSISACGNTSSDNSTISPETTSTTTTDTKFETNESKKQSTNTSNNTKSSSSYNSSKERVTCSFCNGTGKVKYYYGDSAVEAALNGHNDYEYGVCTSCDGKGYIYITTTGSSSGSGSNSNSMVTCPSCGNKVSSLKTQKDAAGERRTWCSSCWSRYNSIMGG